MAVKFEFACHVDPFENVTLAAIVLTTGEGAKIFKSLFDLNKVRIKNIIKMCYS